jgi:hypothetical protein
MQSSERSNDLAKVVRIQQRLQASIWLLDIGWGKPVQPVWITVKGKAGVPLPLAPPFRTIPR